MWRCPSCGEPIEALYEARKMRRFWRGDPGWQERHHETVERPDPFPTSVVQPCGCEIPAPIARTLATPHQ